MAGEKGKAKKVLTVIGNIIIWIFIIFAVVVTVLAFAAQSSSDGVPSIAGKVILTVQTDSMSPTFDAGDIIIGQKLSEEERNALEVGDIITFRADLDEDGRREENNSHRIVEVLKDESGAQYYKTKGDNAKTNVAVDQDGVYPADIICKYSDIRIPKIGTFLNFIQQPTGFLLVVVLPLVIFFIYELIVFIRKFIEVKNSGKKQITAADEEEIKQRAIEEYLAQQKKAEQEESSASEDGNKEEVKVEDKVPEEKAEEEKEESSEVKEETAAEEPKEEAPETEVKEEADTEKKED